MKIAATLFLLLIASCSHPSRNTVRIATIPVLDWFPVYLAMNLGYFREEGVAVEHEELNSGTKMMEALVAGSRDVDTNGLTYAVLMAAQGRRLKAFFNVYDGALSLVVVSPHSADRIRDVVSLKGATIGVGSLGGYQHRILAFYLHRAGLRESDVQLISIGAGATSVAAVQHAKVDAAVMVGSSLRLLNKHVKGVRVLIDPRSRDRTKELFGADEFPAAMGLLATEKWLAQNPQSARKLTRAMLRTLAWIRSHSPEEVLDWIPSHLRSDDRTLDLDHLRVLMALLSKDGRISQSGAEAVQRVLAASMDSVQSVNLASTWTNQFLDPQ